MVSAPSQQVDHQSRKISHEGIRGIIGKAAAEGAPKLRFLGVTHVPEQKNTRTSSDPRAGALSENEGDIS